MRRGRRLHNVSTSGAAAAPLTTLRANDSCQGCRSLELSRQAAAPLTAPKTAARPESPPPPDRFEARTIGAVDGLIESRQLSLAKALELLALARSEAEARGLALAAAVVDPGGNEIASQRMDGAVLGAMRLAQGKAYTAVLWSMRSGDLMESTQPGGADWGFNTTDERVVVYAGGLPLYSDGQLVGGVGASGGTAEQDEECVSAAVRVLGLDSVESG